ncbi:Zn_clus Fungal Zn 2-Cys 6 binuclear cluster domain containing protein [Fusarium acuminatum]|uniref:Zn_clus Fungal Zn 2-Cys 6 binuclear cluster domain containing protein n=1 Tax=Fusarium acuminatum TaxID=5515 RepID=A0ABZ2WK00_9HYPO
MSGRKTRSRGACANCKARKRKCDQTRPACVACQSRNQICDGYQLKLQWGFGVASRGRFAGSAVPTLDVGPDSERGSTTSSNSPSVNYSVARFLDDPLDADDRLLVGSPPRLLKSDDNGYDDGVVVDENDYLLTQFLESGIYKLFATSVNDRFLQDLRQATKQSPALVTMCCAFQLMWEHPETESSRKEFENAVRIFQDELEQRNGIIQGATLCAGSILCTLSMIQGLPWTNQLHCMTDLYSLNASRCSVDLVPDAFTTHGLRVIGVMDLPGLVFGRRTPIIGLWRRLREAELASPNGLTGGVDTLTGMPRSLLDILAYTDHRAAQFALWNWHGEMGDSLQAQLWDAWRYAGIIYRNRMIYKEQALGGNIPKQTPAEGLPSTKYLVWRLIASLDILRLALDHPTSKGVLYGNSGFWPYIIARCEFELLRESPDLKTKLDGLYDTLISVYKQKQGEFAQAIIQEAWDRGDTAFDLDGVMFAMNIELPGF